MTMIDASKGFDSLESTPSKGPKRKRSFTEKIGHSAFEEALSKSQKDESHWEAGLHASTLAETPANTASHAEGHSHSVEETHASASVSEEDRTGETSPAAEELEVASPEETTSGSQVAVDGEGKPAAETIAGDFELPEDSWSEADDATDGVVDGETEAPEVELVADSSDTLEHAGDETSEEFSEESQAKGSSIDADADVSFEVSSTPDAPQTSEPIATNTPQAPIASSAPATFVESFGRQAFARSTQLHRAQATAPASLDMNDLVEQIAKVRGNMSTGRARVVIGEGSDRLALTVLLKNGTVNIDARVADAGMAQSLERGTAELSEALGKHGLSLGTMDTGGGNQGTFGHHDEPATSVSAGADPVLEPTSQPQRLRRGVRIVA